MRAYGAFLLRLGESQDEGIEAVRAAPYDTIQRSRS